MSDRENLRARLMTFEFDDPASPVPFSVRLAKEQGWDATKARRVLVEYRRFLFLAMTCRDGASPSVAVDAAWHLHLLYTQSYWTDLCEGVLGRALHHEPSRGGAAEDARHAALYARTLEAYREAFGEDAPRDLWPRPRSRSGRRTMGRQRALVLVGIAAGLASTALIGCRGAMGPFNLGGPEFLVVYAVLYGLALLASIRLGAATTDDVPVDGAARPLEDRYEIAYLAGGERRMRATALVALVAKRLVDVKSERRRVIVSRTNEKPAGVLPATEARLYDRSAGRTSVWLWDADLALREDADALKEAFVGRGWVVSEASRRRRAVGRVVPFLALAAFGAVKVAVGVARERPVGLLLVGIVVALVTAAFRAPRRIHRTALGERVLAASSTQVSARMRTLTGDAAALPALLALGVAIDGMGSSVLAEHDITRDRFADASAGSEGACASNAGCAVGGGCSGGGGGGGDGGGSGCGGCGGGGD